MVSFYDPIDSFDQKHAEQVLRSGSIEYFLGDELEAELGTRQILIAEEDIPKAEQLLVRSRH